MNYKCSFPKQWLGLENEELQEATGLASAGFCHKGGFLMTVGDEADAIRACGISLEEYEQKPVIVCLWDAGEAQETKNCEREETEHMLRQIPDMTDAQICHMTLPHLPDLEEQGPALHGPGRFRLVLAFYQQELGGSCGRVAEISGHGPQLFGIEPIIKPLLHRLDCAFSSRYLVRPDVGCGREYPSSLYAAFATLGQSVPKS